MKKLLSLLLVFCMLASMMALLPVVADEGEEATEFDGTWTAITSADEFMAMKTDAEAKYYLANDIDFTGKVPANGKWFVQAVDGFNGFKGILDGNGKKLTNINITSSGDASIFGCWFQGTVRNLTVGTEETPAVFTGTGTGSVAALTSTGYEFNGVATFENVTVYATITNNGRAAAFTAYGYNGSYAFKNCVVNGSITGGTLAAGYIASDGSPFNFTIENCVNNATVQGSSSAAGFVTTGGFPITGEVKNSINNGNVTSTGLSAGGIYTSKDGGGEISLTVEGCANYGTIIGADWRAGGIIGQFSSNAASTLSVNYCYNAGEVFMNKTTGEAHAAGIVGGISGSGTITNVYNVGNVHIPESTETVTVDERIKATELVRGISSNVTVSNGYYLNKDGQATRDIGTVNNVSAVDDADALLAALQRTGGAHGTYCYIASNDENYTYPVLLFREAYSESAASWTEDENGNTTNCEISSPKFTAFYSTRDASNIANGQDLRLVLAANIETLKEYGALYLNIEFLDVNGVVVKTGQYNVRTELKLYQTATGGGVNYTAQEGSALFGIIIKDVPNDAWNTVNVSLGTTSSIDSVFVTGAQSQVNYG